MGVQTGYVLDNPESIFPVDIEIPGVNPHGACCLDIPPWLHLIKNSQRLIGSVCMKIPELHKLNFGFLTEKKKPHRIFDAVALIFAFTIPSS
ncbi:hypothetical protein [Algoriphagus sp. AK58]|uniref:hypothetical protein n=1 Tax=Algoriphagus sp. AK58 TaxID=1406877 RepID=UPI002106357D|nr:hypothetical protein [Algoriphagus sp. AK58]